MRDCEHGQLARSCEVCELKAENEQLRAELKKLQEENAKLCDQLKFYLDRWEGK